MANPSRLLFSMANQQTKIHVTLQTVAVCRDTLYSPPGQYINTYNCDGTGTQIRIDSFFATPNLDSIDLYNTAINTNADSVLIYRKTFLWDDPFSPYWYGEEIRHGFFVNANSGFLLFKVNEKKYALKINMGKPPFIERLINIDP